MYKYKSIFRMGKKMSGKKLKAVFLILLFLTFIIIFLDQDKKKNEHISHVFGKSDFSPPEKTPYNGFIVRKAGKYRQSLDYTCGPASVVYYLGISGIRVSEDSICEKMGTDKDNGSDMLSIKKVLESHGIFLKAVKGDASVLEKPGIIQLKFGHFVVFLRKSSYDSNFLVFDPEYGEVFLFEKDFLKNWSGYALVP